LPQVIGMIAQRFGQNVHRRSLERALSRKKNIGWRIPPA